MENSQKQNATGVVYTKDPNMVARKIADEMVLVPIREDTADLATIHTLNTVGADIWELLDGIRTVAQIIDAIVASYKVTAEQAQADILEFMAELAQCDAVSTVAGDNADLLASQ